jgi:hypothetical protein
MRRVVSWFPALTGLILLMSLLGQMGLAQKGAGNNPVFLKGTYVFTLTEKCVHQLGANTPGFDSNFHLVDPAGAETYSGASDGFMIFDGGGGVSVVSGRATNIMNATNRLIPPLATPVPLGFGLGPALPFSCTGTYSIVNGKITALLTCNASLTLPNVFNSTGFRSQFTLEGALPHAQGFFPPNNLLLTDIGNTVQPVTIFFATNPVTTAMQQRICTRSTNLVLVSVKDN